MLYDIAFLVFSLFYLPVLIFKGRMHGAFGERFGIYSKEKLARLSSKRDRIWIEAVSVGEVSLCKGLIPAIRKAFPEKEIILSTVTRAGNALAYKLFSKDAVIVYFPLDLSFIVRRFIDIAQPKLYIMIETEIWPNVITGLKSRGIPSLVINGRISDRSYKKYVFAKPFMKNILKKIDAFCMQSRLDRDRIVKMGAPEERVRVTGSMKFDAAGAGVARNPEDVKRILSLVKDGKLLVAGSTHEGEEAILLKAAKELAPKIQGLRLIIAPRHVERCLEIEALVRKYGFRPIKLSAIGYQLSANDRQPVYILDTIGQLKDIYSAASIVFIGGSLIRHGGQNPIEPAALGKPVIFGPHMFNFRTIASLFLERGAAVQVRDERGLIDALARLMGDSAEMERLGAAAKKVAEENRGATEKSLKAIQELLK